MRDVRESKNDNMSLWEKCLGMLYPQTCYFCGEISRDSICEECADKVEYIQEPRCKKCGKPIRYAENEFCHDCEEREFFYDQGKSIWLHKGPVRWSIYQFKYHNRRVFAQFYAKEWWRLYREKIKEWGIDVIIPIPLHRKRRRKRGYNQAEILARELGKRCGIPVDAKSVVRVVHTKPQKELNHTERNKNLRRAFCVTNRWKKNQNILLIDDIYTTGNTIDSVAQILKEKGAQKVYFLTISIGQGF